MLLLTIPTRMGSRKVCRTSKSTLLKAIGADTSRWEEKIPLVQFAMNNKVATLHSSSPFSLMFGRASNPFVEYNEEASSTLTEEEMEKRWADLHEIVYPAIAKGVRRKQESVNSISMHTTACCLIYQ